MTWFKVDDSFHSHPKTMATELAALGLWVVAGSWSGANLTDGFVPEHVVQRLSAGQSSLAETLVDAGLWRRTKGGYRFHDWSQYQPTKDAVLEQRKAWREKKSGQRKARKPSTATNLSPGDTPADSTMDSRGTPEGVPPSRSRPDPVSSNEDTSSARTRSGRGSRIPDDFTVTADMAAWARAECPDVDGRFETAQFVDYWRSRADPAAAKADWPSAWRTWMRRAQKDARPRRDRSDGYRSQTDANIDAFLREGTNNGPALYALPGGEQ